MYQYLQVTDVLNYSSTRWLPKLINLSDVKSANSSVIFTDTELTHGVVVPESPPHHIQCLQILNKISSFTKQLLKKGAAERIWQMIYNCWRNSNLLISLFQSAAEDQEWKLKIFGENVKIWCKVLHFESWKKKKSQIISILIKWFICLNLIKHSENWLILYSDFKIKAQQNPPDGSFLWAPLGPLGSESLRWAVRPPPAPLSGSPQDLLGWGSRRAKELKMWCPQTAGHWLDRERCQSRDWSFTRNLPFLKPDHCSFHIYLLC